MNTLSTVQMLEVTGSTVFESTGDAIAYGLPLSLFGFATVFSVLVLIWAILALFKVFFYTIPNARSQSNKIVKLNETTVPQVTEVKEVPVVAEAPVQVSGNDSEIVAAIIAAIEAYRAQSGNAVGGFRVVSFRKRI